MRSRFGAVVRAASLVLAAACAHVEPPPGGPEDNTPPRLAFVDPESLTIVPNRTAPVVLRFDERISERNVETAVSVSPRTSTVLVDRGRDAIRVSLRDGWEPGVIYHVNVSRTVLDLFGNALAEPISVVFSTGPPISNAAVQGLVTDRTTGLPEADARVEAIRRADSLVYAMPTDSSGAFLIAHLPAGPYLLRAYRDINRNRALDGYEARDTASFDIQENAPAVAQLAIAEPDSTPAGVESVAVRDSGGVELRFDDYLDPDQVLTPAAAEISDTAGTSLPVFWIGRTSSEVAADTTRSVTRLPTRILIIEPAAGATLAAGARYRITVRGVRNLAGLVADVETELEVPAAPAAAPPP